MTFLEGLKMTISPTRRVFLMQNAPRVFARLLEQLMLASLITQSQLARRATAYRQQLIDQKIIETGDTQIGAMSQTAISNVIQGVVARPTDGQLWIWLEILQDWYQSAEMRKRIEENDLDMPAFPDELKRDLEILALRGSIDEIDDAYERCKDLDLLEDRPVILPSHSIYLPKVRQKFEHETDYNLQAYPSTGEIYPPQYRSSRGTYITEDQARKPELQH
jgi:hypothetical protein